MPTDTPWLFRTTDVRVATRAVAIFQFWLEFVHVAVSAVGYAFRWRAPVVADSDATAAESYDRAGFEHAETDLETFTFSQITNAILIMYTSYFLRKATYNHNLHHVNYWMIVCCISFVPSIAFAASASLRTGNLGIFVWGSLGWAFDCYKLYVVYKFYVDELYSAPATVAHGQRQHDARSPNNLANGVDDRPAPEERVAETAPDRRMDDRY